MAGLKFLISKLGNKAGWERLFRERLSEPLHLNLMSLPVALVGSFRSKIYFDLIVRQQHAYCLLSAADQAKSLGLSAVTVIEFGVANGAGMPAPVDYRDHPEFYRAGWFPMESPDRLRAAWPPNASLIIGDIAETCPSSFSAFRMTPLLDSSPSTSITTRAPWRVPRLSRVRRAYVFRQRCSIWMMCSTLGIPSRRANCSPFENSLRRAKNARSARPMRESRLFKRASWTSHIYVLHVFDDPARQARVTDAPPVVLANAYLGLRASRIPASPTPGG